MKGMPSSSGQHGVCWCGGWEKWKGTTLLREDAIGVPAAEVAAVEEDRSKSTVLLMLDDITHIGQVGGKSGRICNKCRCCWKVLH